MDNRRERLAAWKQTAEELTREMRSGNDPFMERLREIIVEAGLEPQEIACASAFDDQLGSYEGTLVLADGSAIDFSLDFHERAPRQALLAHWGPAYLEIDVLRGLVNAGRELLALERRLEDGLEGDGD